MRKKLMATFCTLGTLCLAAGVGLSVQTSVSANSVAPTVTLKQGASARLHATEYGIRFTGVIDNYDEDYTYGMYIFPAEYLDDYTSGSVVEHAQSKLGETPLAGGDCKVYMNGSAYQINGALTGLSYNNFNREFVAVAYAKDAVGNYTYSDVSVSRNIVWVAGAALDDTTKTYDETQTSILNDFIKLGYHQAVGTEETAAKAATTLPEISVGGTTEVYNVLWATPTPTFIYGGETIAKAFNPYASEVSEGLSYTQKKVRSNISGSYTLGYANIAGTHTVTVRDMDETPNSAYFGECKTVKKDSAIAYMDSPLTVKCAKNAELMLINGANRKGFSAGAEYTVTETGIELVGARVNYFGSPSDLYVYEGDTLTIYRVAYINNFFATTETARWYIGAQIGRDTSAGNVQLFPKVANAGLAGRDFVFGYNIEYLKLAYEAGYYSVNFDVTVTDSFAAYEGKGIRVYASEVTGRDGVQIMTGQAGVTLYRDFGTQVTGASTFTVKVVLADFLNLNANAKQIRFVLSSSSGDKATFTNFCLQEKPNAADFEERKQALLERYGFSEKNNSSTANGGIWDVNAGGTIARSWDATKQAMKLTMANANSGLSGRDFVNYTSISMLKDAYNAGFTTMTFKVTSEDGAFIDADRGIRVYSKQTPGRAGDGAGVVDTATAKSYGTYIYKDFGTAANTTEFTVVIDIAEFLALNENANYFAFVLSAPNGTSAYLSDLNFTVAE